MKDYRYFTIQCRYAIASQYLTALLDISTWASRISALATWRQNKVVFRFDVDLISALKEQAGDIIILLRPL
ncbi:MAG TPA: hypothetical protein VN366_10315 [Feifaniaceae bacterium]|nr:hypothetical protein [Feifaniaceae bacterium]